MLNKLIGKIEDNVKSLDKAQFTSKPAKKDFQKNRLTNIGSAILSDIKLLQKKIPEDRKAIAEQLTASFNKNDSESLLRTLAKLRENLPEKQKEQLEINLPKLPQEIKDEIEADIKEIKKCYSSGCYRSAVILCGRLLETALHRKYYETTGNDILEKNPGIGLGNLIAKLFEKGVELDPGLTQQIHLVNQVRIFSVHKKQRTFYPSKTQTNAIILFTTDTLEKLF